MSFDFDKNPDAAMLMLASKSEYMAAIGTVCKKCGIKQGEPYKAWKNYFCKHVEDRIHRKLLPAGKAVFDAEMKKAYNAGLFGPNRAEDSDNNNYADKEEKK